MPQPGLGVAHRPLLENTPQACAGCDRLIRNAGLKPGGVRVFKLLPAHLVVVVNHAQADGVCLGVHRFQYRFRPGQITVCADADNPERLAQKLSFQIVIVFG